MIWFNLRDRSRGLALVAGFALALTLASGSAPAQQVEARGEVTDADGNPIKGAVVKFWPKVNPSGAVYEDTTNKKGKYFIPGMFTSTTTGNEWDFAIEMEGMAPSWIRIESRASGRVLVDDIETEVKFQQRLPTILIRPLGEARVDFVLSSVELLRAQAMEEARARGQVVADAEGAEEEAPKIDPWAEGLRLAGEQDFDAAIPMLEEAVEEDPDNDERREWMAKVLSEAGRYDDALVHAEKASELQPEKVSHKLLLFTINAAAGDMDSAKTAIEAAKQLSPDDPRIYERQAFIAEQTGDHAAAVEAYEKLVEADESNAKAWAALGDLYAKAGNNAQSEAAYQRVAELDPTGAHKVFFNIGALIMGEKNPSEAQVRKAVDAFRRAVELKPDYAKAHKELGLALLQLGDTAGASASLMAYVEAAPDADDAAGMKNLAESLK